MRIATAEYTDLSALTTALGGAHVVISTVTVVAIHAQVHIAQVAKAAGAQVFIPGGFGGPTEHLNDKKLGLKERAARQAARGRSPLLLVYTGAFSYSLWIECVVFFVLVSFVSVWLIGVQELSYVNLNVKGGYSGFQIDIAVF